MAKNFGHRLLIEFHHWLHRELYKNVGVMVQYVVKFMLIKLGKFVTMMKALKLIVELDIR